MASVLSLCAVVTVGCSGSDAATEDVGSKVAGVTQTPRELPTAPTGFTIEADGEVWIVRNATDAPEVGVVDGGDGVALGGGTIVARDATVLSVDEIDPTTIEIVLSCVRDTADRLDYVEYSYDGSTLSLDTMISGGYPGGESCDQGSGIAIQLPLPSEWNPDAEVTQTVVR